FRNKSEVYYSSLTHKEKKEIISKVKILKLDQVEAEILTNQESIEVAAKELIKYGPTEVLITHEKGLSVFLSKSSYFSPWKNKNSIGRTGRGDTAFISYLGSRLTRSPEQSVRFSAALTSIKLEIPGPFNLPLFQVERLLKKEY
ncbi:MAG: carbohydrate kinase family protein, partial [Promethearchaeota archaeon]